MAFSTTVLPSPPTSPRIATTRIRIKPARRPNSLVDIPSSQGHEARTRSMSPSLSKLVITDPDTPGSEKPANRNMVARNRRQSSITYYTPSSPAPWDQRLPLNKRFSSSVDISRDVDSVMINGKENASKRSSLVFSSRSPSTRESVSSFDAGGTKEREPLTLVEK